MRAALVLLLLVATGCPASSESSATEPNRAPPPPATAPTAPPTAPPTADVEPAPAAALAVPAPGTEPRTVTLPGTTVAFELVAVTLPRAGGADADAARTLWVARTETTWDAYDVYVYALDEPAPAADGADAIVRPSQPYVLADYGYGHAGFPVICVSAAGAEGYCAWLSARTGRPFRLPTEAEWEALCAGGAAGRAAADQTGAAWVRENAERRTHAVGTAAPDALGLFDLLGNVTEWCRAADGAHVARGGCFLDRAEDVGCDARRVPDASWNATDPQLPKSRWWLADANFAGFRVVCDDAP